MNKRLIHFIPLLLVASFGFAQDTVLLKNGDVLTGEILEQNEQHVFFKSGAFGSVSLSTRDIAEIKLQTEESDDVQVPPEALTKPSPEMPAAPRSNPQGHNPQGPAPQDADTPKAKKRWSGEAGMSFAMRQSTRSNQSGVIGDEEFETYRLNGKVQWKGDRNGLNWDLTYRYSESDLRKYDDFLNLTQKYNYSFQNENYFATAKTVYQRDYRRQIEDEYLQTAEMGVKWFTLDKFQLTTSAGGGYHMYDRLINQETETLSIEEPKFIFDESLRWQLVNTLTFIQKYTHLGDLENYHFVFSAGLENKLVQDLFLQIEYRLDRDTEVFYDDKGYYDRAVLTKLLYKF